MDSLIGLYRTRIRSKKWYLRIFFHMLDLTVVNAWLLYKQCCSLKSPPIRAVRLHEFKAIVAEGLCKERKEVVVRKASKRKMIGYHGFELMKSDCLQPAPKRTCATTLPAADVQHDGVGHWPLWSASRQRCKRRDCVGMSRVMCLKCKVHLCFNNHQNCFLTFHRP